MKSSENGLSATVIVCAYNEEDCLQNCLDSLVDQDLGPDKYEIILMDNESSDRTPEIGKAWVADPNAKEKRQYIRISHVGLAASRNTGLQHAKGQVIAFIDADGKAEKDWLRNLIQPLLEENEIAMVGGRIENLNDESSFARFIHKAHFRAITDANEHKMIGANMAFRRDVFEETGGFITNFYTRGDESSLRRLYFKRHPEKREGFVPEAIVYNEHVESLPDWLKQRFLEGQTAAITHFDMLEENSKASIILKAMVKGVSAGLIVIGAVMCVFGGWIPGLYLLLLGALRHVGRRSYLAASYRMVKTYISSWKAPLGSIVAFMGLVAHDMGNVSESVRWLKGTRQVRVHETSEILESIPQV